MRPLCPDDNISFTCDVETEAGSTVWEFSNGTCELMGNRFPLIHKSENCRNASNVCGPFTAHNCDPGDDQYCTVSTLTIQDLSKVANGTVIQCYNHSFPFKYDVIGTATIVKEGQCYYKSPSIHPLNL